MESRTEEQKTEISPFDMICDAALSNDPDLLSNALQTVCIDVWQESDYGTPVTRLAYNGEVDAVKFLLDRGASPANAACGYARGDHMKELYDLLSQVKKQNPNKLTAVLKQATYGVALNQDAEKLDAFWKKITEEYPDEIELLYGSLAKAHAQKGNMDEVDKLWEPRRDESPEMATEIISGLALGGHVEKINSFYDVCGAEAYSRTDNKYREIMVVDLARGGHKDKVSRLKNIPSSNAHSLDELIIQGLGQNGIDENTEVHTQTKLYGFVVGGYKTKAFEYAKEKNLFPFAEAQIIRHLIAAGHFNAAMDLLKIYPNPENASAAAYAYASFYRKNTGDAKVFLEKMKKDEDIVPKQVTQFIITLASSFFSDHRFSEALYFFEKEPTEEVLSKMLSKFNNLSAGTTKALKIILMRHNHFSEIILQNYLTHCIKRGENPDLSLIAHAAVLYPEIVQSLAEPLKKSGCDLEKLNPKITQAKEDITRLGFTTMRQLVAWRDPVIRYILLDFEKIMIPALIENVISFLSDVPVSNIVKGRAFFSPRLRRPTPKIPNIGTVHASEESKITPSGATNREEQKVEISPFDMICDAALSNDPDLLSNALQTVCIDVWQESDYGTPVTRLAYLGKVDAVKFLLDKGASPANAACGYARAGRMGELYDLIEYVKEKNPDKLTAVLKKAAYGIALSQNKEKIKAFLEKIEKDYPTQIPEFQSDLSMGHAQANNLTEAIINPPGYYAAESEIHLAIVKGMALNGNVKGIERFIKDIGRIDYDMKKQLFNREILICLARGGHSDKAPSLSFYNPKEHTQFLIMGQAQNGVDDRTFDRLTDNAKKSQAFAFGGHKAKAYQYGKPEDYDDNNGDYGTRYTAFFNIGVGFINGNHFDAAYDFFKNNMSHKHIGMILTYIAGAFFDDQNSTGVITFLEKMQDDSEIDDDHLAFFSQKLTSHYFRNLDTDRVFRLHQEQKASLLHTHLTGPLLPPLIQLIIEYSKRRAPADAPTLNKNKAAFFTETLPEVTDTPTVQIAEESKSESKITPSGITQEDLRNILDTYKPAHFFGRHSGEIKALYRLALDPQLKGALIHHTVIASILSPYPKRHALFTNLAATVSNTDTDRIILEIRKLYQEKGLWENHDSRPGRKNRKR